MSPDVLRPILAAAMKHTKSLRRFASKEIDSFEEWRNAPGFAVSVSSLGRVRGQRGIMRGWLDRDGYRRVTVKDLAGKPRQQTVHKLVALAFIGPRPTAKHTVAHRDGLRSRNPVSNLRWATMREQYQDRIAHGTVVSGASAWNAKLTQEQADHLRALHRPGKRGFGAGAIGLRFGITKTAAQRIIAGRAYA